MIPLPRHSHSKYKTMNTSMKNLTRYTLEKTSFLGWRLSICRSGLMFTKYFADKLYDGEKGSLEAARSLRDEILEKLKTEPSAKVLAEYQARYAKKRS